jgi:hypothetical protein
MAKKQVQNVSKGPKKAAKPFRQRAVSQAARGWTNVERDSKPDASVSSSADAVSKSLADLKARQFGVAASAVDAVRFSPPGKSRAKTVIRKSQGQEKSVTLVNQKISSFQG